MIPVGPFQYKPPPNACKQILTQSAVVQSSSSTSQQLSPEKEQPHQFVLSAGGANPSLQRCSPECAASLRHPQGTQVFSSSNTKTSRIHSLTHTTSISPCMPQRPAQ